MRSSVCCSHRVKEKMVQGGDLWCLKGRGRDGGGGKVSGSLYSSDAMFEPQVTQRGRSVDGGGEKHLTLGKNG